MAIQSLINHAGLHAHALVVDANDAAQMDGKIDDQSRAKGFARHACAGAAGVDRMSIRRFQGNLEENLRALLGALKDGTFQPLPARRVYIDKEGGKLRPLGIPAVRDRVILAAYGSPDPYRRQIDGVGGAQSVTSKVAVISPSPSPGYDVVYRFGQVSIDRPIVDYKGNCGNMSAAVGPFAVDEGLVAAVEPVTRVRIHQKNTDKLIIAEVPVRRGKFDPTGDYAIDGVPGTGSRILLRFVDPAGAVTGRLFPTGNRRDRFDIAGLGAVEVSCVDAANPFVFVRADALGLKGTETEAIEGNAEIKSVLEAIRCRAAVELGITATEEEATRRSQAVMASSEANVRRSPVTTSSREARQSPPSPSVRRSRNIKARYPLSLRRPTCTSFRQRHICSLDRHPQRTAKSASKVC